MELAFSSEPWEPSYDVKALDECNTVWLRALSTPTIIESLLVSINTRVEETGMRECFARLGAWISERYSRWL